MRSHSREGYTARAWEWVRTKAWIERMTRKAVDRPKESSGFAVQEASIRALAGPTPSTQRLASTHTIAQVLSHGQLGNAANGEHATVPTPLAVGRLHHAPAVSMRNPHRT